MVNVGVVTPNPLPPGMAFPDIGQLARLAETVGLDGFWAEDSFVAGDAAVFDIACVLAAAAGATERIEIGSAVFVPSIRNPLWACRQIETLQMVAGDRLRLGVALGAASDEEYRLADQSRSDRRRRTDEFLEALTSARSDTTPPVWIGGTSPAALRRAVHFGDGWLSGLQTPAELEASSHLLGQLAEEAGRPRPLTGTVLHVAVGSDRRGGLAATSAAAMQALYGVPAGRAEELAIGGTPEQVADQIAPYLDAGAVQLCLVSSAVPYAEHWPMLAEVRRILA